MAIKYTPAPWGINRQYITKGREVIATINSIFGEEEMVANAKLIEQAPIMFEENKRLKDVNVDLLEALIALKDQYSIAYYEPDATEDYKEVMDMVERVIDSATQ